MEESYTPYNPTQVRRGRFYRFLFKGGVRTAARALKFGAVGAAARGVQLSMRRSSAPRSRANTNAFAKGTYANARAKSRGRRRLGRGGRKKAQKRRRFTKAVKRVMRKVSDKRFVSIPNYLQTTLVTGPRHLQNHVASVFKFVNPASTSAGGVDMGTALNFPIRGDLNNQFDGKGYYIKGLRLTWGIARAFNDSRTSMRLYLMKSKQVLDIKNGANLINAFWSRMVEGYNTYDETQAVIQDEYSVIRKWDIASAQIDDQAPLDTLQTYVGRSGTIYLPLKIKVNDADMTVVNDGVTMPAKCGKLARMFWVLICHKAGAPIGDLNTITNLNTLTQINMTAEMHFTNL